MNITNIKSTKTALTFLSLALTATSLSTIAPGVAAEPSLRMPAAAPVRRAVRPADAIPDQLLVMAGGNADMGEFNDALQSVKGTVINTIGEGMQKVYVVQTERGQAGEAQKKLSKDENVAMVQRNWQLQLAAVAPKPTVNDPFFPSEWHIAGVNATAACWKLGNGHGVNIGVMDIGVPVNGKDIKGKAHAGYDAFRKKAGQTPAGDHGSLVSTTAAAATNNKINTAAVAPGALIFPLKICDNAGVISEAAILEAIYYAGTHGIRILNLSANGSPPDSLSNQKTHPAFHTYCDWYHNQKNGLLVLSAGNDGVEDASPFSPNIMVVSAINKTFGLASFSTYGNNLWFTAPGQDIFCSDAKGRVVSVSGTSFSAPCTAAVAAMILSRNPKLKNTQIEKLMVDTRFKAGTSAGPVDYTKYYGFGLPNAEAAVKKAI